MPASTHTTAPLPATPLGKKGPKSSRLGLGCMGMSDFYSPETRSKKNSIAAIHRAIDLGVNHIDTADMYGPFTNEELVGEALKGRRHKVLLATKFGQERTADGKFVGINGRPEYVQKCCDASLRRLGVDCIDLYYQHRIASDVPVEETVGAMSRLVEAGKVRYLGLSEASASTVRKAHKVHKLSAVQCEYALWWREPEVELLATLRGLNISFVSYGALGRGFLTGNFTSPADLSANDARRNHPRFSAENLANNRALLAPIERVAIDVKASLAQIALAWVLAQGSDIICLFGTTKPERIEENVATAGLRLSPTHLDWLDQNFPMYVAKGDRYADMSAVNR